MTGPCRVMRHSVTALRLEMVPATSIVGRRSADGTQINQVYLIVVVKSSMLFLVNQALSLSRIAMGSVITASSLTVGWEMDSAIKESTDFR